MPADSIAPLPPPKRPRKFEHRAGSCPRHGDCCAFRRERHTQGPFECVECAHEAGTLLEPAPSPAPAASPLTQALPPSADVGPGEAKPAEAVGGGAGDLPPGWKACDCGIHTPGVLCLVYGASNCDDDPPNAQYVASEWSGAPRGGGERIAPTMLQAMCAALGIELTAPPGLLHTHATYNGEKLCNSLGRESCARLALERYHARQQAEATANMPCVYCHGRGAYNDAEGVEYVCGSCNGTGANDGRRAPRAQPEPPPSAAALADASRALRDAAQALDTAASQLRRLAGGGGA